MEKGFEDIKKAVFILVLMLGTYSLVELSWLKFDSKTAEKILIVINSNLYARASENVWWPPLLWPGRLRSLLREPSFLEFLVPSCYRFYGAGWGRKSTKDYMGFLLDIFV